MGCCPWVTFHVKRVPATFVPTAVNPQEPCTPARHRKALALLVHPEARGAAHSPSSCTDVARRWEGSVSRAEGAGLG